MPWAFRLATVTGEETVELARLARALADDKRVLILAALAKLKDDKSASVSELVEQLDMDTKTVIGQIGLLIQCDAVEEAPSGSSRYRTTGDIFDRLAYLAGEAKQAPSS